MAMAPLRMPARTMATPSTEPPGVLTRIRSPLAMPRARASSLLSEIGLWGCTCRRREAAIDMELMRFDLYELRVSGQSVSGKRFRMGVPSARRVGYQVGQPTRRSPVIECRMADTLSFHKLIGVLGFILRRLPSQASSTRS